MSILVSINCITYNHEKYITDAIEGFLKQETDFEYEILIGEDCSTDNTRMIVEEYIAKYPDKIRLITSSNNVGARQNSLRLMEQSQGKYIALCEGDDYWLDPTKLQKQIDYMEKHPDCTMCFHAANIVDVENKEIGTKVKPFNGNRKCTAEEIILGGGSLFPTAAVVFVKEVMENPPELYLKAAVGDFPIALILTTHGYAYYIDEIMSAYRAGVSGSWTNNHLFGKDLEKNIIKNYKNDLWILDTFNKYSNGKYAEAVQQASAERRTRTLLMEEGYSALRKSEYYSFFKGLPLKKRVKILAYSSFPGVYKMLSKRGV